MKQKPFRALGKSRATEGDLETFTPQSLPSLVALSTDEFTALCPVTGQPDFCSVTVTYVPDRLCVESKSAKLYLRRYRSHGAFCEDLSATIARDFFLALNPKELTCTVVQVPRGGIRLTATTHLQGPT